MRNMIRNLLKSMKNAWRVIKQNVKDLRFKTSVVGLILAQLLIGCVGVQNDEIQWYDLTKADKVELYVENDGFVEPRVRVFLKPIESTRREFLEKLTKLHRIEAKHNYECSKIPVCVLIPPVYDYELHCKAFFDGEEKDFRFLMRNKTFIYNTFASYYFDAKRYFPKALWQKLHTVYDSDYNREADRRFPNAEGDCMPTSL